MNWFARLVRRTRAESDSERELRDHVERRVPATSSTRGWTSARAKRQVTLELGGVEQVKEAVPRCEGHALGARPRAGRALRRPRPRAGARVHGPSPRAVARARDRRELRDLLARQRAAPAHPAGAGAVALSSSIDKARSWTEPDLGAGAPIATRGSPESAAAWGPERFDLAPARRDAPTSSRDFTRAAGSSKTLGVRPRSSDARSTASDDRRGGGADGPVAVISYQCWQDRFGGRRRRARAHPHVEPPSPSRSSALRRPASWGPVAGPRVRSIRSRSARSLSSRTGRPRDALDPVRGGGSRDLRLKPGHSIDAATRRSAASSRKSARRTPPDWRAEMLNRYLKEPFELDARGHRDVGGPGVTTASRCSR